MLEAAILSMASGTLEEEEDQRHTGEQLESVRIRLKEHNRVRPSWLVRLLPSVGTGHGALEAWIGDGMALRLLRETLVG